MVKHAEKSYFMQKTQNFSHDARLRAKGTSGEAAEARLLTREGASRHVFNMSATQEVCNQIRNEECHNAYITRFWHVRTAYLCFKAHK